MKLEILKKCLCACTVMASALAFTACSDNDDPKTPSEESPNMWGEVLRGDNMTLQFYPDHFAYYWEYTFDSEANPDLGLVIRGQFPDARFLSYNVYDDNEQTSYCDQPYNILDVDIKAEDGSENPFLNSAAGANRDYVLYVLPTDAPASITEGKKNIIWFDADVKKVCTILRYYIPEPNIHGGVDMPVVKGFNVKTGKTVAAPKRQLSGLRGEMELPGAAFSATDRVLFFRAPFSFAYPNGPAEYCYHRNVLATDDVILFNFKAPSYPKNVEEFNSADMRYWSVCVGNQETYTPLAICDKDTKIDANGFANYILADKNSSDYAKVRALAEANDYNVLEWDGSAWGDGIMILYRNMVFADDYPHSMRILEPVGPGVDPTKNPTKYISVLALGQWGATGAKLTTDKYIAAGGKVNFRQPAQ